jgi:hypothetical protein
MPRKKTVQPEPIGTFTSDDGAIVEVRDEGTKLIGRVRRQPIWHH